MKKIAYIELDTHAEIAANFMELMKDSEEFEVDYYFSEKILKQIGQQQSAIFLSENTELLNLLNKQNYELIIIGTVHRYFNLFKEITTKYNTSVIVHNVNFTRISRFQLFKNIFEKDFIYRLKLWLKEDLLAAPEVFRTAKNLLVLDESLVQNRLRYLPVFFNQNHVSNLSGIFTIVIPGAVSQQRRDYRKVLQELTHYTDCDSGRFIQVIFLGKAQGKELKWLRSFEKGKSPNITIQYFTDKVSQNIFDEWMNNADVLWCPIQKDTQFFGNKEIYGKTKMSGNIGDAIKYGKVAFFPESYPSNWEFIINEKENSVQERFHIENDYSFDFQVEFGQSKITSELENSLKLIL